MKNEINFNIIRIPVNENIFKNLDNNNILDYLKSFFGSSYSFRFVEDEIDGYLCLEVIKKF